MTQFNVNTFKNFVKDSNNPYLKPNVTITSDKKSTAQQQSKTDTVESKKETNPPVSVPIKTDNFTKTEEKFKNIKKNRGLFEKFYDFCKNTTGFGQGYKKLEKQIEFAKSGKISQSKLEANVERYKQSTANSKHVWGDTLSSLASLGSFFGIVNLLETIKAQHAIGATKAMGVKFINFLTNDFIKEVTYGSHAKKLKILGFVPKLGNGLKNIVESGRSKKVLFALPISVFVGGMVKYIALKINRIGSKEFSIKSKKELGKEQYKIQKKAMKKAKRAQSFKNFWTGMANGLFAPITMLGGGIIGTPLYLAATTGTRYITSDNDKKSLADFGKNFKDNILLNSLATLAVAIPAYRTARFSHVLNKNLHTVTEQLKNVNLIRSNVQQGETALEEMQNLIYASDDISGIMNNSSLSIEEKIRKLTDENIFAVKFLQTDEKNSIIAKALKESCPVTRTLEEASADINRLLGTTDYQVSKCLGVGTIAETYLAKDSTGKEVAVKILKKGISSDKILQDKEKFLKLITNGLPESQLTEHQKYLIRNLDDLASTCLKEVDLENEMKAAQQLVKVTKRANVVQPILAKNGIYVMEKADGISFQTLYDYAMAKSELECLKKMTFDNTNIIKELEDKIAKIKAKSPSFADFDITPDQVKKILKEYIDVYTEQFVKVNKNGKLIHGDLHPGNIFVDLDVLKGAKKGKLFTLIDTGNVINMTKDQSKDALRMTAYIKNGNYKDIARIVTEESILPNNITRDEARQFVETELKKYFTDTTHALEQINIDKLYHLTDAIQNQKGIIPNNVQLTLNKSKKSANDSFLKLFNSFGEMKFGNADPNSFSEQAKLIATAFKDMSSIGAKMASSKALQETKNLLQMSPMEAIAFLRNKNMLPLNSTEHLIYKFKQQIPLKTNNFEDMINNMHS